MNTQGIAPRHNDATSKSSGSKWINKVCLVISGTARRARDEKFKVASRVANRENARQSHDPNETNRAQSTQRDQRTGRTGRNGLLTSRRKLRVSGSRDSRATSSISGAAFVCRPAHTELEEIQLQCSSTRLSVASPTKALSFRCGCRRLAWHSRALPSL